jgi:hypothetical protein
MDLWYVVVLAVFFLATRGMVALLDRLMGERKGERP